MGRVLVVEDDAHLAEGLAYNLSRAGHEVIRAADGPAGLGAAIDSAPDLVLLDLMLPGFDGYELLRRLRAGGKRVPVLILSARAEEADKLRGFDAGAVDYVTKPFGIAELLARVQAHLAPDAGPAERFALGERIVDLRDHSVTTGSDRIPLTPTETEILRMLHRRVGVAVPREDLLRGIWGAGPGSTRTLDAHVTRLRKKIESDPKRPRHLVTVHSIGYRLAPSGGPDRS